MSKRQKKIHDLSGEQFEALKKFQKDFQTVAPQMQSAATAAKTLFDSMIEAPVWRIAETPRPQDVPQQPEMWSVGHAKVNYVDHIDREGQDE